MTFPVVGSNIPGTYQISNSLRFNDGDSPKLTRTNTSGGDRQTFTLSTWLKLSNIDIIRILFDVGTSTTTDTGRFTVSMNSANKLFVGGGATSYRLTSRVFRDVSAWYHIVIAVDSTQATADDRIKIYINFLAY